MLPREGYLRLIKRATTRSPVTALLGPRQCGKTTLARAFSGTRESAFFDLESEVDLRRLANPEMVLGEAPEVSRAEACTTTWTRCVWTNCT